MPGSTTISSGSTPATPPKRRATTSGTRVKNLAEKIAAIRERRERCQAMLAELDRTGESQISLTGPDSRAMAAHTRVAVGYNAQVAVDAKHQLIVEQQVTNQVADMGLLTPTAEPAKAALGVETIAVVADRGYFRSRISKPVRRRGWSAMCRARSEGQRSGAASIARTNSATSLAPTAFCVRPASGLASIRHLCCVG